MTMSNRERFGAVDLAGFQFESSGQPKAVVPPSPFRNRKSLLAYRTKDQGQPCAQGETSKQSGCIPASGEASVGKENESGSTEGKPNEVRKILTEDIPGDSLKKSYGEGERLFKVVTTAVGKLSASERKAVASYTAHDYKKTPVYEQINNGLRTGKVQDKFKPTVNALDAAIAKSVIPEDMVLYRKVRFEDAGKAPQFSEGDVLQDQSYASTTTEWSTAHDFQRFGAKAEYVIRIAAPKGTPGLAITKDLSGQKSQSEKEIILGRGLRMKVVKVEEVSYPQREGTMKTVHVEII